MEITVYTTPTCPYCQQLKRFLSQRGIVYEEKDVSRDRNAAMEMVQKTGQRGVPVTFIDGEAVVGFNPSRLDQLLSAKASEGHQALGLEVADAQKVAVPGASQIAGAYVGEVKPGSVAERSGFQKGDVITAIGTTSIKSADDLASALQKTPGGTRVRISYRRGTQPGEVEVTL